MDRQTHGPKYSAYHLSAYLLLNYQIHFMRITSALVITIVMAFFLSACKHDYVTLDSTTAKGEVPALGNLTFRFNKALHPDSLLNNWDSTEYISFEPKIPGRFRWNGPEELVFSPSQPLLPATTYKAAFKSDLFEYSKYNEVKSDEVSFHTAPLKLEDASMTWLTSTDNNTAAQPQITLHFNYPIKAEDLKEKLSVDVDDAKTDYTLTTSGTASEIGVRLAGIKATEDKPHEAKLTLATGIKPAQGTMATTDAITQILTIPSPYVLSVSDMQAEHTGTEGIVRLNTSQQVAVEDIGNYISFEPALTFNVESSANGIVLQSDKFNVENSYSLRIKKGLHGKLGGMLKEDYSGAVGFGQLESGIKFTNSKAVYLSRHGAGNIEVQVTNTPRLKIIISKIYENNLLLAAAHGYEPKDDKAEPQYASYEGGGGDGEYDNSYTDAVAGDVIYTKET